MHPNVHSSTIYNSQDMETPPGAHQHTIGLRRYDIDTEWNGALSAHLKVFYCIFAKSSANFFKPIFSF